jgi:predicted site-specific integrase-resolvase
MLPNMVARAEVQAALGVSRGTLIAWARRGYGPAPYRLGGEVKYIADEVAAFVKSQRIEPGEPAALVA